MTLETIAPDDGVGDQRVRSHDTAQQERGGVGVAQHGLCHDVCQYQRYKTGEQSEDDEAAGVLLHTLHVHLQSGKEHDIVETHTTEEFEGVVALQDIEAILSDDDTCQHHADDVRDAQLTHHDRRQKDNHQHHKEDQCGVGNREI